MSETEAENRRPWTCNRLVEWLLLEGWTMPSAEELVRGLGRRLVQEGIPVCRLRITIRILHPLVAGFHFTWIRDTDAVEEFMPGHAIRDSEAYRRSPYFALFDDGAKSVRRRLDGPQANLDFPILKDLKDQGVTDYLALPIIFSDGGINALTVASDQAGGFSHDHMEIVNNMVPALARLMENHALRRTAVTLLDTYLGHRSGDQVLQGRIHHGDGGPIRAVIWFCDLRDSTRLAESMESDQILEVLNDFFGCMAGAVLDHGGEVLRYIGDAVLAIFPVGEESDPPLARKVATTAVLAARDAHSRLATLNQARAERGAAAIDGGIALHIGEVMYGNIGVPSRLEFTVIGAAANEAARIENMCKKLQKSLVVSQAFAEIHGGEWAPLGRHELRGLQEPRELFALPVDGESA